MARATERYRLSYRTEAEPCDPQAWMDTAEALRESDPPASRECYAAASRYALGLRQSMALQEVRSLDRILDDSPTPLDFASPTKEEVLSDVLDGDYQVIGE